MTTWRQANKRRLIAAACLLSFVCLVLVALALLPGRPRLTEEQFDMIDLGMTLEKVEEILRCKPGDYSASGRLLPIDMRAYGVEQQERREPYKEWAADYPEPPHENANGPYRQDAVAIRIWFDKDNKVIDKCRMGFEYTLPSPSLLTRIKRALFLS